MSILTQDFCNCNTTSQFLYSVPQPMSAGMTYAFSLSTCVTALLELVSKISLFSYTTKDLAIHWV